MPTPLVHSIFLRVYFFKFFNYFRESIVVVFCIYFFIEVNIFFNVVRLISYLRKFNILYHSIVHSFILPHLPQQKNLTRKRMKLLRFQELLCFLSEILFFRNSNYLQIVLCFHAPFLSFYRLFLIYAQKKWLFYKKKTTQWWSKQKTGLMTRRGTQNYPWGLCFFCLNCGICDKHLWFWIHRNEWFIFIILYWQ